MTKIRPWWGHGPDSLVGLVSGDARNAELAADSGERNVAQPESDDLLLALRCGDLGGGAMSVPPYLLTDPS